MSDPFEMSVDTSLFEAGIKQLGNKALEPAERAAKKTGLWLLNAAVNDAPVNIGLLRSSASVFFDGALLMAAPNIATEEQPRHPSQAEGPKNKNSIMVVVGFNTHYAAENDTDRSRFHPKGGKAGYLTDNFAKANVIYERFLKAEYKGLVK